jgi:hypothetical protein
MPKRLFLSFFEDDSQLISQAYIRDTQWGLKQIVKRMLVSTVRGNLHETRALHNTKDNHVDLSNTY